MGKDFDSGLERVGRLETNNQKEGRSGSGATVKPSIVGNSTKGNAAKGGGINRPTRSSSNH